MNAVVKDLIPLTVQERAIRAIGLEKTVAELREIASASVSITEITNKAGYDQAHQARMVLRGVRIDIEKRGKSAREDATKFREAVIEQERELVAIIKPEESRLADLQGAYDAAIEREKQAKIDAEIKRVADINARIADIRGHVVSAEKMKAALVLEQAELVGAIVIDDSFEEFQGVADDAKTATVARLMELHTAKLESEAEQAKIAEERAELARLRKEQEEATRRATEELLERERVAKAARDKEQAEQAERERIARDKLEDELRAERYRISVIEALAKKQQEELDMRNAAAKADAEAVLIDLEKPVPVETADPVDMPITREAVLTLVATHFNVSEKTADRVLHVLFQYELATR
jgi:hypothetical protein